MNCKYSKIDENLVKGRHLLICTKTNEYCAITRYCPKVKEVINIDGYDKKCKIYIKEKAKENIDKNKVLFEKNEKLYIENDGQVLILANPFDYTPNYVSLFIDNGNCKITKGVI